MMCRTFSRLSLLLRFFATAALGCGSAWLDAAEVQAPAPAVAGQRWSLERALNRAMEANPELVAAKHEVERQEGLRLQVQARLLPSVSASASINQRDRGLVDVAVNAPPSEANAAALHSYDMRIEVRQLVFDGLSSWHQNQRQKLLSKQAYLTLQTTAVRTASMVRQSFEAIQLRTTQVEAEQRRIEEFVQVVKSAERKKSVGEIPEYEYLRAEAELQGARAELAGAIREKGKVEQTFKRLLQISDLGGPIELEGEFGPRAFNLPLPDAISRARANRPDVEAMEVALEAAKRNQRAQVGNYLPKFEVFASYGSRSSYYDFELEREGWTVGALGQWAIFDGGASRGRQVAARAERRAAESKLGEIEHRVASTLHELYQGLDQSRVAMEAQQKSVSLAARAWHDARRLYEVGQVNFEQVLQAAMSHRRAESQFNESVYDYNALIADIEFNVGGQLEDSTQLSDKWKP